MNTTPITRPAAMLAAPLAALDARVLGAIGMAASPMMLVETIRYDFGPSTMDPFTSLGGVFYMIGAICSLVALRRIRASGDGAVARWLHRLQLALAGLAAVWSGVMALGEPFGPATRFVLRLSDPAWPLTHVSMLALGLCMVVARRVEGWRRFPALACGLALPSFFALVPLGVPRPLGAAVFGVLTTVGFFGLGLAALTSRERS